MIEYTVSTNTIEEAFKTLSDEFIKSIEVLYCPNTKVSDLSPLQHCSLLKELYCSANAITDLSPLQNCPLLKVLYCSATAITDLSPLQHCPLLEVLYCPNTKVSDLSPLQHCSLLKELYCSANAITDLSPLQNCPLLKVLYCSATAITDLSPLQHCPLLEVLYCSATAITDLSPLQHCHLLKRLDCNSSSVSDLSPLQYCPLLKVLHCNRSSVSDLSPLQYCPLLKELYCGNAKLSDLSPLQYCTQLQILYCANTQVSNLSPLQHCIQLCHISYIGCPIEFIPIQVQRIIERNRRANTNVYIDSQSVHNHSIQQSLIKSVNYLSNKFSANLIKAKIDIIIPKCLQSNEIHSILNITLEDCYKLVYTRILEFSEDVQKELLKRLNEEVVDGESMCFTGKFTRLVNTLVGFDENVRLDISQNEQISAIIINEKDKLNPYDKEAHINAVRTLLTELNISSETQDEWINEI